VLNSLEHYGRILLIYLMNLGSFQNRFISVKVNFYIDLHAKRIQSKRFNYVFNCYSKWIEKLLSIWIILMYLALVLKIKFYKFKI